MKTRTKLVALGAAAVLVAGVGTYAVTAAAEGGFGPSSVRGMMMGGGMGQGAMDEGAGMMGMMGGGHGQFGAGFGPSSHLGALKTELGITTAQETAWAEYTKTVTEAMTSMRATGQSLSGEDGQAFMTGMHEQGQKMFDSAKAAAETLVASLDDAQKVKARQILPGLASGPGMMGPGMMGGGMGGGSGMSHGMGG